MLKFIKTFCVASVLSTIAWTGVAHADGEGMFSPLGSYRGGGYKIILDGRSGDYVGFDRQGRKLVIHQKPSYPTDGTVQWINKGYTYRVTGIGDAEEFLKVRLTISNPQGRVILTQILNKVK
jgi:hypothetical protein